MLDTSAYIVNNLKEQYFRDEWWLLVTKFVLNKHLSKESCGGGKCGQVFFLEINPNTTLAVKVQPFSENSTRELKYMDTLTKFSEQDKSHAAWLIDDFQINTELIIMVMMKAYGDLGCIINAPSMTNIYRKVILKHCLVSVCTFHESTGATHRDAHGGNFLVFKTPMEKSTFHDLDVPACDVQVVLYDPGYAKDGLQAYWVISDYINTFKLFYMSDLPTINSKTSMGMLREIFAWLDSPAFDKQFDGSDIEVCN